MARHWREARSYLNCDCVWGDGLVSHCAGRVWSLPGVLPELSWGLLVVWGNLFCTVWGSALGEADRLSFYRWKGEESKFSRPQRQYLGDVPLNTGKAHLK